MHKILLLLILSTSAWAQIGVPVSRAQGLPTSAAVLHPINSGDQIQRICNLRPDAQARIKQVLR